MKAKSHTLLGYITSGRGKAKEHIRTEYEEFIAATGEMLVPGSMNILLCAPVLFDTSWARICSAGERLLWPARLKGKGVWIYRFPHAPLHVVEVLSDEYLREKFRLDDGAAVELEVASQLVMKLSFRQWLAWQLVWRGREPWAYKNDRYYLRTRRFSVDLGATQRKPTRGAHLAVASFVINGFR